MNTFVNYQSITLGFIDGKFVNATLFISIENGDTKVCDQYIKITDYAEAMKALRRLEKVAGRSADLIQHEGFCRHDHWSYIGKMLTFCDVKHD